MGDADRIPALEDRLDFERLVCDLAARFVNLEADRVDDEIRDAQRRIVEALDLDRSTLFELNDSDNTLVFTHYWSRPEFPPVNPVVDVGIAFQPGRRCAVEVLRS